MSRRPSVPEQSCSQSNMVTLREYVDTEIRAVREATKVAQSALERRLDGMNEFRDSLKDQAGSMATKEEMNIQLKPINERIRELELTRAELQGKASQISVNISYAFAGIATLLGIINLLVGLLQ